MAYQSLNVVYQRRQSSDGCIA